MNTDYLFICPTCKKLTIATGSGDVMDLVTCHDCRNEFKARLIAGVGEGILIKGHSTSGMIDRAYQVCE